ncbi:hypothetical protein BX661DRAFT_184849 [Kickxella alabastrina]|uniref:uncharacterized protein n=1 Tax=Kickxella alabastrina TaxID=61397 RepID=UPI00221ED84F|nr:uncharacterized protein BX661DRAFT_184849 [Kickxella alabastrina]KAI7825584.1 hypothetical protein BX661DRAFT_184849 [Kickxella alabastrina]
MTLVVMMILPPLASLDCFLLSFFFSLLLSPTFPLVLFFSVYKFFHFSTFPFFVFSLLFQEKKAICVA